MTPSAQLQVQVTARVGRLLLDVELDTGPGTLVIIGPNGAGKSSLLSLLLGVLPAQKGRIRANDTLLLDSTSGVNLAPERRRLGYLPQSYALFPHLSVRENVEFALTSARRGLGPSERWRRVQGLLENWGLEHLAERRPDGLSGGEQQRVALARALAVSPRALLLDEPLAALDVHSRGEVRALLCAHLARVGLPTIVVTHDPVDARLLGTQIAVLEQGHITQQGTWGELCAAPGSPFIKEFIASA